MSSSCFPDFRSGQLIGALTLAAVLALGLQTQLQAQARENPRVIVRTNYGNFVIELYPYKAPVTVENFLKYVQSGFYDGLVFHRVIPNFMIQGGGHGANLKLKLTRPPIPLDGYAMGPTPRARLA